MIILDRLIVQTQPHPKRTAAVASTSFGRDTPHVLALSVSRKELDVLRRNMLCVDRKAPLEHLEPGRLIKSTIRVTILQGTQLATQYLNDQLREDMARDTLVEKGVLTPAEAHHESDTWTEREWQRRWAEFPRRLGIALAKYHAIILVMRLYEHIASKYVSSFTLDRLTLDTFDFSKSLVTVQEDRIEVVRDMTKVCLNANLIAFLADYSVHQLILFFGYYTYARKQRQAKRIKYKADESSVHGWSLTLSFVKKSSLLALSRGIGLGFASVGGALGCVILPGWGTLAGTNLGDGIAASLTDELTNSWP